MGSWHIVEITLYLYAVIYYAEKCVVCMQHVKRKLQGIYCCSCSN